MLFIDTKTECPIYEQIYRQIRDKIMSSEWKFNMKLPSSRQLASELQISRNTIEQAYQQLYAEGYLFSKPRIGYYVEKLNNTLISPHFIPTSEIIAQDTIKDQYRYNFRYGKLDYRYVPFKIWKDLMLRCFGEEMDGLVSYSGHQGDVRLREQITKYAAEYRGVKCNPEQIVVGAGTLYCLELLCNLLRKQATRSIGFEDPGYGKARTAFKNAGFKICPIGVDKDGINIKELDASGTTAVYVTPSHQFPTGAIMSISKRLQLLEWANRKQAIIIEDDYSCHFRYNVRPIPSLQGINQTANVAYLGNFSKSLLPSLRLSFIVLPLSLLDSYKTIYQKYNTTVPYLFQRTLERFMRDGYLDRHLRRVLQVYKKKHDCLVQSLNREFGDKIKINGRNAGLFVTVKVNSKLLETQLINRAAELGVRVYPVSDHWERLEQYDGKTVLLGYSSLELDEIEQGVQLLRRAWFG